LISVRDFVQENCKITPVNLALKLGKENYEKFIMDLTSPSIDSVLVAKETNTLLWSDDMVLRDFAKIKFDVNGVWTQPVLQDCVSRDLLSKDSYHEVIARLVFANYNYVPVKAATLVYYLEKNGWNIVAEVARLFQVLSGPTTSIESALKIAANFIKEIWSKSLMHHQKIAILDLLLSSLVRNRLSIPIIRSFTNSVRQMFQNIFTPWYGDEIIAHTHSWLQTHLSINQKNLLY